MDAAASSRWRRLGIEKARYHDELRNCGQHDPAAASVEFSGFPPWRLAPMRDQDAAAATCSYGAPPARE